MEKYSLSVNTLFRVSVISNAVPQFGQVHPQSVSARVCPLFHACPHSVQVMMPFAVRLP